MDWQPIETAPKTGEIILVGHGNRVWISEWLGPESCWLDSEVDEWPSHWMPMPDPPDLPGIIKPLVKE